MIDNRNDYLTKDWVCREMKDIQGEIGYKYQLLLGLLYRDGTEYYDNRKVYLPSKEAIFHIENINRFIIYVKLFETVDGDANISKLIQRVVSNKSYKMLVKCK